MQPDILLSDIRIASPCTVSWEQMAGNDQVRHCAQCNLNVYNFSEMTAQQVEQLITASNGERVCGRLYRRADGSILTSDCPVGLRARIHRVSRRLSTALAAVMSLACTAKAKPQQAALIQGEVSTVELGDVVRVQTGLRLSVIDDSGAALSQAQIVLIERKTGKKIAEGTTDQAGNFIFPHMPAGKYTAMVQRPGFQSRSVAVSLKSDEMREITVQLYAGRPLMGIVAQPNILPPVLQSK
jgi:hypothetical protein